MTYAGLKSNLKINLEFSNEVWGGIFSPFIYNYEASQQVAAAGNSKIGDDGSTDPYLNSQRYYLERTMEITNIFRNAFSSDGTNDKVRSMLCAQEGNYYYFPTLFPWFEQTYGSPSNFFYGVGNANYENTSDYTSVDSVIAGFATNLADQYTTTERFTTTSIYYGLQNIAYEGGPGTAGASTADGAQISLAASRDPRMENAMFQLYNTWYAAGGNIAVTYDGPFDAVTPYNQAALGDLSQINNPTASAKYRGVVDLSQAAPTVVTAGNSVSATGVTTLPITSDGLGSDFTNPSVGQTGYWLLNVATAGNYNLFLQVGAGQTTGEVNVSLSDKVAASSFTLGGAGSPYVTTLALHAGLNTLALGAVLPFTALSLTLSPQVPAALNDSSFEQAQLPSGRQAYVYDPAGTPWTFLGTAGVSANNTDFTSGNGSAPQGQQVAFLQKLGSISQTVTLDDPGVYTMNFVAANRTNYGSVQQTVQVIVDGSAVGTFVPTGAYTTLSTSSFYLAPGSHTFTFKGLSATGDATAFVDGITLVQGTSKPVLSDSGFETVALPTAPTNFVYNPTGTAWSFTGSAGVTGNNSYFSVGNPAAPEGQQVAFLQNTGSISQLVNNWTAGNYTISFDLAQRQNYGLSQTVQVLVDGVLVGTFPPTTTSYKKVTTASFAVLAGSHKITIRGTSQSDATDFLDDINVNPQ